MNRAITVRNAGFVGTVFTAAVGLLPKLTCPLCWPAYSAALGALGLGFADYTPYLMPVTAGLVALTILALAWISRRRHSIIPLVIGTFAGVLLMLGKFVLEDDGITFAAAALLVVASFLPVRRAAGPACRHCVSDRAKEMG